MLLWGNEDVTRLHLSNWCKSTFCRVSSVNHTHMCTDMERVRTRVRHCSPLIWKHFILALSTSIFSPWQWGYIGITGIVIPFSLLAAGKDGSICILNYINPGEPSEQTKIILLSEWKTCWLSQHPFKLGIHDCIFITDRDFLLINIWWDPSLFFF